MTERDLKKIKDKIEKAKNDKVKAEVVIENIKKSWKKQYDFDTVEEAKKKIEEFQEQAEKYEKKLKRLEEKLKDLVDWKEL
jgi:uncharacterized protein (DUF342 family)